MEDMEEIYMFLGVDVKWKDDGIVPMPQPHLITILLELVSIDPDDNPKDTPALNSLLLKMLKDQQRSTSGTIVLQ